MTRLLELQRQQVAGDNAPSRKSTVIDRAAEKLSGLIPPPLQRPANPAVVEVKQEAITLARRVTKIYDDNTLLGADTEQNGLIEELKKLTDSDKDLMRMALRRYATPTVRLAFEDVLEGKTLVPSNPALKDMVIPVATMLDHLEDTKAYCGIVSKDAMYWLQGGMLVRSDFDGKLSFPLHAYEVKSINMSPDQRIHAQCESASKVFPQLLTLNASGIVDASSPLSLPQGTYLFAVANNNTVFIATRDDHDQSALMVLNGYDRAQGHTEFSPLRIAALNDGNGSGSASVASQASNARQAASFPATQDVKSLVVMPQGHLALLFNDNSVWRLEQQPASSPDDAIVYQAIPAMPLPPIEQHRKAKRLKKRDRPHFEPRPAPVPDRLIITPTGAFGAFEADGTPLLMNVRQDWMRLRVQHNQGTPLKKFYSEFAPDVIPTGGLSFLGFPQSSEYIKAIARQQGFRRAFERTLFPFLLRAGNESRAARSKDYMISHYLPLTSVYPEYRRLLSEGHHNFFGAIQSRLDSQRQFLNQFIASAPPVAKAGHDTEFTTQATQTISGILDLITSKLPLTLPAEAVDENGKMRRDIKDTLDNALNWQDRASRSAKTLKNALHRNKPESIANLAVLNQALRYKNYHKSSDKVRSHDNVLHVAHAALSPILGEEHRLVEAIDQLLQQNVFLGFAFHNTQNVFARTLNLKQDHYNEVSIASSLLLSHVSNFVAAELKAAAQTADAAGTQYDGLLNMLGPRVNELDREQFKTAALQHMRGEKSELFDGRADGLSGAMHLGVLDITALEKFAEAYNHFSAGMKLPNHKVRRALEGQGVLGTHDIVKAYEAMLAQLPPGSSITVVSRRAAGIDLEGMSLFFNLLSKKLVQAATSGTVQVFAIEPVIQLTAGRESALTIAKTETGLSVTLGKANDVLFTPIAFKAQFGFGISKGVAVTDELLIQGSGPDADVEPATADKVKSTPKAVLWAYIGCNLKGKDTMTWVQKQSMTVNFSDKKTSSALQTVVRILAGDMHPADILSQADSVSSSTEQGLIRVMSLDVEPLVAAGMVWDLVTDSFKRQGKILAAGVEQLNLVQKTENAFIFNLNGTEENYTFKVSKRNDGSNTEIWVSEIQGVPVGDGLGLDGKVIPNGNEYGQQKVQPFIHVRTRRLFGTPVTTGVISVQFDPQGGLTGMATAFTYQRDFLDLALRKLKKVALSKAAVSLENYIPPLNRLLSDVSPQDRARLQKVFREVTTLSRDFSITVHVQFRPDVIEKIRKEMPNGGAMIFSPTQEHQLDVDALMEIAKNEPDSVQVSQIEILTKNIYKTGVNDGITLLRTSSESSNTFTECSSIIVCSDPNDPSALKTILWKGSYFKRTTLLNPNAGLLSKGFAPVTRRQLGEDGPVLQFLADPYRGNRLANEDVLLIQQAMDKLRTSVTYRTVSELPGAIDTELSKEERTALAAVFQANPSRTSQSGSKDGTGFEWDALTIFKIVESPDYFLHFKTLNEQLLGTAQTSGSSKSGTRYDTESRHTSQPPTIATNMMPGTGIGGTLGPILTAPSAALPVVQKPSQKSFGSRGSRRTEGSKSVTALTATSSKNIQTQRSIASDVIASPATPVGRPDIDPNRLHIGWPGLGTDSAQGGPSAVLRRVTERDEAATTGSSGTEYRVASGGVIGFPEDQITPFKSKADIAASLRTFLKSNSQPHDLNYRRLKDLLNNPDITDDQLLDEAGIVIQTYKENPKSSDDSRSRLSYDSYEAERREKVRDLLLDELRNITSDTSLTPNGLYHQLIAFIQPRSAVNELHQTNRHQDAITFRNTIVSYLTNNPYIAVDWLRSPSGVATFVSVVSEPCGHCLQEKPK